MRSNLADYLRKQGLEPEDILDARKNCEDLTRTTLLDGTYIKVAFTQLMQQLASRFFRRENADDMAILIKNVFLLGAQHAFSGVLAATDLSEQDATAAMGKIDRELDRQREALSEWLEAEAIKTTKYMKELASKENP